MFLRVFTIPLINRSTILLIFMLMACKALALHTLSSSDFNNLLKQAEQLNNIDPKAALKKLAPLQETLIEQTLINQVNFYRIQSEAYSDQALYTLSKQSAEQGLMLAKQMNNPSIFIAELAYTKGFAMESLGNFESAIELYQNGLDISRSMSNKEFIARGLTNLAAIDYQQANYKHSLISLNQALDIASKLKDDALMGDITSELGILYGYLGEEAQANSYFQQSFEHYKAAGKHNYALNSLHNVAINHSNQERYEEALKVYRVLEKEIRDNTTNEFIFSVYRSLAWALLNKNEPDIDNAYRYMVLAGEYVKELEQHQLKLQYLVDKAYTLKEMKRYEESLSTIMQAQVFLNEKDSDIYASSELEVLYLIATVSYSLNDFQQAHDYLDKYFQKRKSVNQVNEISEIDELRLQYESEQASLTKSILEQKQQLKTLQLGQAESDVRNRKILFSGLAIILMGLAWGLHQLIKRQSTMNYRAPSLVSDKMGGQAEFIKQAQSYYEQARAQQKTLSIALLSIRDMKGLQQKLGDKSLAKLSKQLVIHSNQQLRDQDVFSRLADHEFIFILPDTDLPIALEVIQRLKDSLESKQWLLEDVEKITLNVGVAATSQANILSFTALVNKARERLNAASKSLENRVYADE